MRVVRDFEFYAMTFLAEVKIVQVGEEGAVSVDGQEVAEVLGVLTAERVHGEVRPGPGIHISVETAF